MKKIVFLIGSLYGGGAERVISVLSNSLCKKYEVTILMILEDVRKYKLDSKVKIEYISLPNNLTGIKRNILRIKKMRRFFEEYKPDIVISFLSLINMFSILACLFTPYKLILSERNDPKHEPNSTFLKYIRNVLYNIRNNNYFVFQTEYAQKCFNKKIRNKSKIIFNPLKKNLPSYDFVKRIKKIVTVARLEEDKNIPLLLEAFNEIYQVYPEYILEIYGEGTKEKELKELVKKLNLENNIFFKGFQENVHQQILDAIMFVLPSNYEGISNAMIEALAIGIPSVVTDSPAYGARTFIKHEENGFLVDVNSQSQLVNCMRKIIADEDLDLMISNNSKKINQIINEESILKEWEQYILEIINEKKN